MPRRRSLLLAAAAGLAGLASPAGAQHAGHGAAAKRAELGFSAASAPDGKLWVLSKAAGPDGPALTLRSSIDEGRSWLGAQTVRTGEAVAASGESRPKIAIGRAGELYIAYTKPVARPHIGDIRFMRSLDGGVSFSAPVTVHANRDVTTHSFESMIVAGDGRIYIAWVDGRDADAARARGERYAGSAIYYAVSSDGGASFRGDYKVADHSCECCRIGLALDARGTPVAFWRHIFAPNIRDHALSSLSPSGSVSAPARATFDDWRIDACPHHGPALAFGADGTRHQVWFSGDERNGGVRYAAATGDKQVKTPGAIGSAQAAHADLALRGERIAIVWKEADAQATAIMARLSMDGGKTWRQTEAARTAGDSSKPYLVAAPSGMLLAWNTAEEGMRIVPLGRQGGEKA